MKQANNRFKSIIKSMINTFLMFLCLIILFESFILINQQAALLKTMTLYHLFFSISFTLLATGFIFIFDKRQKLISVILLVLIFFVYGSQLFYYSNFQTYYTLFSLTQAGQLTDFYREIFIVLSRNSWIFLALLVPTSLLTFIIFKRKTSKGYWWLNATFLSGGLIIHALLVWLLSMQTSPLYDYYFYYQQPDQSVRNFGLLTSMRLDIKNAMFDVLPFVQAKTPPPPEIIINPSLPPLQATINYNVLEFNWDRLKSSASNELVLNMHEYFSNKAPTNQNEYTGIFKGKNLIVITAEAFSHYAIREDITPTLAMMANQGIIFENFYNPVWGVSTSDGEYVVLTSLIPKNRVWSLARSSNNYFPLTYGQQFLNLDYLSMAFHNHTYTYYQRHLSHPNLGYEYIGVGNGLNLTNQWPPSDLELMQETVDYFTTKSPFHIYYMTVSGHQFYTFTGNMMSYKNRLAVQDLPYSSNVKAYLAAQIELDKGLEFLINALKQAGVYEDTVIVISADHYPYGLTIDEIEELANKPIDQTFELYRSSLIIHVPEIENIVVDKPTSSMDILPTISNLFGLEYDSRLLMGTDVFSDHPPMVIFYDRSFIVEQGRYSFQTNTFTPNPNMTFSQQQLIQAKADVDAKFYYSTRILDNDYYRLLWTALIQENPLESDILR